MTTAVRQPGPAALTAVRVCYGSVLLLFPGPALRCCGGQPPTALARRTARVLGMRHLAQAALTALAGQEPAVLGAGAAVDLVHALSMAGLGAACGSVRRVALTDMALETALAAAGTALARN